ncbi:ABC transporter ATP-binding protein [Plantactinospora sonchi]|uniref:ABC transporter ATP-binding protein n=1 Tax=Plantactinospora sonchi TaxID=1544735 RepID=A0ABU7RV31_9ACTN
MRLDGVWLRYGWRAPWVLRDVRVELGPGRSAVVLGRNGVGKSTLLQLAAGVLSPTRGTVRERPPTVGWVPERFPANQPYTVEQYLTGMGRVRGVAGPALRPVVEGWLARLGLTPYRDVRLAALSKGTAQKVGLAQALLRPPELLVLDEPWEGLDAATRELVPELIREVRENHGAVLVSDHRGETVRLPDAEQWTVVDGTVSVVRPATTGAGTPGAGEMSVVELAVPATRVAQVVADLRAAGHQVLGVRPPAPEGGVPGPGRGPADDSTVPPGAGQGPADDPVVGPAAPGSLVGSVDQGGGPGEAS